ncbi:MAG: RIP metalloprotease RseP [Calditrichaeota bacterium]|nr:RIP metalloprotease RseP [Calditrichota bacterium]
MIYLVSVIFVFSLLVFIHELGHFLAAKLFGVRVERFSIGYPPRLFGIKIGDTDYCISAIPFGGYVKMSGMIDESMDSEIKGEPYEFNSKPAWQKAIIISAGVIMNALMALVILTGIFWLEGEKVIPTTVIGHVQEGSIGEKVGFQKLDKILAVNDQPVQNWNEVSQAFLNQLGDEIRFKVERNGQVVELVFQKDDLKKEKSEQLGIFPFIPAEVGDVIPGMPAARAGLQKGDVIVAIDDQPIADWQEMTEIVRAHANQEIQLTVRRGTETFQVSLTPMAETEIAEDGSRTIVGKIGIQAISFVERRPLTFIQSVKRGFQQSYFTGTMIIKSIGWLLTGKKSPKEVIGGPIMISKMAGDFARTGFINLMELVAYLSIMLAIINILPLPVLDGGHLAIIAVEAIRRKPLSTETKMRIQQIGMALILMLIVFVIYNDIQKIFF